MVGEQLNKKSWLGREPILSSYFLQSQWERRRTSGTASLQIRDPSRRLLLLARWRVCLPLLARWRVCLLLLARRRTPRPSADPSTTRPAAGPSTTPCLAASPPSTPWQVAGMSTTPRLAASPPSTPWPVAGPSTTPCPVAGLSTTPCPVAGPSTTPCPVVGPSTTPCPAVGHSFNPLGTWSILESIKSFKLPFVLFFCIQGQCFCIFGPPTWGPLTACRRPTVLGAPAMCAMPTMCTTVWGPPTMCTTPTLWGASTTCATTTMCTMAWGQPTTQMKKSVCTMKDCHCQKFVRMFGRQADLLFFETHHDQILYKFSMKLDISFLELSFFYFLKFSFRVFLLCKKSTF